MLDAKITNYKKNSNFVKFKIKKDLGFFNKILFLETKSADVVRHPKITNGAAVVGQGIELSS